MIWHSASMRRQQCTDPCMQRPFAIWESSTKIELILIQLLPAMRGSLVVIELCVDIDLAMCL
jgi:hypothetical protein